MKSGTAEKRAKRRPPPILIAVGVILITFLAYWLLVVLLIPTWPERGLFGDAFGALNTLVSGVALIGVVYALYLQQRQLHEMRRNVELQQQPVVSIAASEFRIDRPSVFTSPDDPSCHALSRFHCHISLSNVSEMPAINLVVNASIFIPIEGGQEVVRSVGQHFPLVSSADPVKDEIMLVPDKSYTPLFQVLRRKDAFALPCVTIELVYRNLLGACFAVRQAYHVVASSDIDADLKSWHAAISSFTATYQEDLAAMAKNTASVDAFARIKESFAAKVGRKEHLSLGLVAIPGAFDARAVSQEHYDGFLNTVGLPRLTFAHTTCPMDKVSERTETNKPSDRTR
jgi:hypothetical protein